MALEQNIKDLQAHNAQFQQMFLALAKGQEDLKALVIKDKKKKTKNGGCPEYGKEDQRTSKAGSRILNSVK